MPLTDEQRAQGWVEHDGGMTEKQEEELVMAEYDMSIHQNPDAQVWAQFFMKQNPNCGLDEGAMIGWFANAMMAMHDHLTGNAPTVLPDGSAFIVQ